MGQAVVSGPVSSSARETTDSTPGAASAIPALRSPALSAGPPQPACLEAARRVLRARGFSAQAAERILQARRNSTLVVYDAKWRVFERWCVANSVDSLAATPPQLANFFLFLFVVKNLSPITIKGYRSAISRIYRLLHNPDPGQNSDLSDLMCNFDLSRPRGAVLFPQWSLEIVLDFLSSPRFASPESCTLMDLSFKTLFLLALASGARVSELHAFSAHSDCLHFNSDGTVSLMTVPGFLSKNRLPSVAAGPLVIKPFVQDSVLCPVTWLAAYVNRTVNLRSDNSQLFLSLRNSCARTSPQLLSSWIKTVIKLAYQHASKDEDQCGRALSVSSLHVSGSRNPPGVGTATFALPIDPSPQLGRPGGAHVSASSTCAVDARQRGRTASASRTLQPVRVAGRTAHELRAISTSLAVVKGASVQEMVRAVGWRSSNAFATFYLRTVPPSSASRPAPSCHLLV